MLGAIVPVASLRGRNQPRVWCGLRYDAPCVLGGRDSLVPDYLVAAIAAGEVTGEPACALVSPAVGAGPLVRSTAARADGGRVDLVRGV
ncbi:MAG: hypothetical protein KIT69_03885 [Propionibacteriaceae bacterium]|nr:hypothetical protein [Propionibacteriaceae bacterium]